MENPRFESGQPKEIFLCPKRPNQFWRQPSLVFNEYRDFSLRPGGEVELSSLSSVEVKNEWNYTAIPRNNSLMTRPGTTSLSLYRYTGLFKMIVGVLTTCHTQYTRDSNI